MSMRGVRPARVRASRRRRGAVVLIVVWAVAICALIAGGVQLVAYRQATLGRETADRIQARWAARAGIENTIAMLSLHTERPPDPGDAFRIVDDLAFVSNSENDTNFALHRTAYTIGHHASYKGWQGPMDEHSKINLNTANSLTLQLLEDITPDVVAAIIDWRDEDDEPLLLGAERDWYASQDPPYEPRNGFYRSVAELELVAGIWGDFVRGEDRNLNSRMDPNENDGELSMPSDEPDDVLEAGWSEWLTVYSVGDGATASGEPRIHLRWAEPLDIEDRLDITEAQAEVLIAFGKNEENTLEQLLTTPLSQIGGGGTSGTAETGAPEPMEDLTDEQIDAVLAECTMRPLHERVPGKININTAPQDMVRDLLDALGMNSVLVDSILYERNSRLEGITSLQDLYAVPEVTPQVMDLLARYFTTTSNVYTIAARGRSLVSGIEVEMIVRVDRSDIPIRIIEYREQ